MDDEETRERLSQDDFEAVGGLVLTEEEQGLVRDAAGDYPEVAGFSFETFQLGVGRESVADKHKDWIEILSPNNGYRLASNYAKGI
jgi:hypothetical protein